MDGIIILGNNLEAIEVTKSLLKQQFKLKDMGQLKYFLGIQVARSSKGIAILQRKYALEILEDVGHLGAKPTSFPMEENLSLSKDQGECIPNPSIYQRLMGRLIYLTITQPDLIYLVHILSRFMTSLRHRTWKERTMFYAILNKLQDKAYFSLQIALFN